MKALKFKISDCHKAKIITKKVMIPAEIYYCSECKKAVWFVAEIEGFQQGLDEWVEEIPGKKLEVNEQFIKDIIKLARQSVVGNCAFDTRTFREMFMRKIERITKA